MTTETTKTKQELLAELLASFSAAELKTALKSAEANKPTLLSLTMDAVVSASLAGPVVTADVTKAVSKAAHEHNVLKADEEASVSSVGALIRYAAAHDAAMVRAGYEWARKQVAAAPEPVVEPTPESETPTEGETPTEPEKIVPYTTSRKNREAA